MRVTAGMLLIPVVLMAELFAAEPFADEPRQVVEAFFAALKAGQKVAVAERMFRPPDGSGTQAIERLADMVDNGAFAEVTIRGVDQYLAATGNAAVVVAEMQRPGQPAGRDEIFLVRADEEDRTAWQVLPPGDPRSFKMAADVRAGLDDVLAWCDTRPKGGGDGGTRPAADREQKGRLTTGLALAAVDGDIAEVDRLIASGADVNGDSVLGRTPLGAVVERGQAEMIRVLVKKGGRIDRHQPPLLITAAKAGQAEATVVLLELGARVDVRHEGFTPLGIAVMRGHAPLVRLLLERGANPRPDRCFGEPNERTTLLHLAASSGDFETFTVVAALFPDVTVVDDQGRNALHAVACGSGPLKDQALIIERLLEAGVNPHARMNVKRLNDDHGAAIETPLQAAAVFLRNDVVATLVDRVRYSPAELSAALPLAVWSCSDSTIKRMLAAGADPDANGQFAPALQIAIERRPPDVVAALLAAGADVKRADRSGRDAMALARIRAEKGRRSSKEKYIGELKHDADAGARILEIVTEHVAR